MRTVEEIDAELRVLAAYRSACAVDGQLARSTRVMDELLDERSAHRGGPAQGPAPGG